MQNLPSFTGVSCVSRIVLSALRLIFRITHLLGITLILQVRTLGVPERSCDRWSHMLEGSRAEVQTHNSDDIALVWGSSAMRSTCVWGHWESGQNPSRTFPCCWSALTREQEFLPACLVSFAQKFVLLN